MCPFSENFYVPEMSKKNDFFFARRLQPDFAPNRACKKKAKFLRAKLARKRDILKGVRKVHILVENQKKSR